MVFYTQLFTRAILRELAPSTVLAVSLSSTVVDPGKTTSKDSDATGKQDTSEK